MDECHQMASRRAFRAPRDDRVGTSKLSIIYGARGSTILAEAVANGQSWYGQIMRLLLANLADRAPMYVRPRSSSSIYTDIRNRTLEAKVSDTSRAHFSPGQL